MAVSTLSRVEAGTRRLTADKLKTVASVLGVSLQSLSGDPPEVVSAECLAWFALNQAQAAARLVEDWAVDLLDGQRDLLRQAVSDFGERVSSIVTEVSNRT
jgi:transcriptional regulator with XRE-family HTH domain